MAIFRLQENMPDVYPRKSRDFQLLCNAFDAIINGVKFDIDSIVNTADTRLCSERLLPLLQTKLGFFSTRQFTPKELRIVLQAFKYVVCDKGSRTGIQAAIEVFLKVANASAHSQILISDDYKEQNGRVTEVIPGNTYIIQVAIEGEQVDTTLLTELLKYVLPAGYQLKYSFYSAFERPTITHTNDVINIVFVDISEGRGVRATTDINENNKYPYEMYFQFVQSSEPGGESYYFVRTGDDYTPLTTIPSGWPNGEYYKRINSFTKYEQVTVQVGIEPVYQPNTYYTDRGDLITSVNPPDHWYERSDLFFYDSECLTPVTFTPVISLRDVSGNVIDDFGKYDTDASGVLICFDKAEDGQYIQIDYDTITGYDSIYLCYQEAARYERVYLPYNSINGVSSTMTHPALDSKNQPFEYSTTNAYDEASKSITDWSSDD